MNKVIIISGISKGLGLGIAKKLLVKKFKVSGFSEKTDDILALKKYKENFHFSEMDIKQSNKFDIFLNHTKKMGNIYGLINNVGYVNEELLVRQDDKYIKDLIEVNLIYPILLTKK